MKKIFFVFLPFLLLVLTACGNNGNKVERSPAITPVAVKHTKLLSPLNGTKIVTGNTFTLELALLDSARIDSAEAFFEGRRYVLGGGKMSAVLETAGFFPGRKSLRTTVSFADGKRESHSVQIILLSDVVPERYTYRVLNTFPHDVGAYTQGLEYVDGWLYESTGQKGESSLRKVSLDDGKVVQIRDLSKDLFGEGITLFGNRIFQITYLAQVGFIYDKKTFELIQKVYYQNKEGWGLCNNGKELIMSDGTNVIYFIDPESFIPIRQIEVYDNNGPVDSLNELEYINGKLYANRYYTDEIEIIDPVSGKIEGKVNLKGILPVSKRKPTTNVLNGIAWDKQGKRLFVTGKYWPELYQIELIKTN